MLGSVRTCAALCLAALGVMISFARSAHADATADAKPAVNLTVNPATIDYGASATLRWATNDVTSCYASGAWIGGKAPGGSGTAPVTVTPWFAGTYTYTLNCSGPDGPVQDTAVLTVLSAYDQQIWAAQQTASDPDPASSCGALSQNASGSDDGFYWEIGTQYGIVTDLITGLTAAGSVQPAGVQGTNYTRDTQMFIASASKWIFGAYVAETQASWRDGMYQFPTQYVPFLNFTSGYDNMTDSCPTTVTPTVQDCLDAPNGDGPTAVPNGTRNDADVGRFAYNSGHLEVFEGGGDPSIAGVMNGAEDTDIDLTNAVQAALSAKGVQMNLLYSAPIPAGGIATTAGDYASFLQGMLQLILPLNMRTLLLPTASDPYAVCTGSLDPACRDGKGNSLTVYSPLPPGVNWHYSITHWIEDDPDTGDGAYSSPGKYGFYPWIDASRSYYGIVARYDTATPAVPRNAPFYQSVLCGQAIRKAFFTGLVQP